MHAPRAWQYIQLCATPRRRQPQGFAFAAAMGAPAQHTSAHSRRQAGTLRPSRQTPLLLVLNRSGSLPARPLRQRPGAAGRPWQGDASGSGTSRRLCRARPKALTAATGYCSHHAAREASRVGGRAGGAARCLPDSTCPGGNARHTALPRQSCRDLATRDFHCHIKSLGAFFDLRAVPVSSNPDAAETSPERQRFLTRKLQALQGLTRPPPTA